MADSHGRCIDRLRWRLTPCRSRFLHAEPLWYYCRKPPGSSDKAWSSPRLRRSSNRKQICFPTVERRVGLLVHVRVSQSPVPVLPVILGNLPATAQIRPHPPDWRAMECCVRASESSPLARCPRGSPEFPAAPQRHRARLLPRCPDQTKSTVAKGLPPLL